MMALQQPAATEEISPTVPRPLSQCLSATTILLCRHGESVGNRERRFQGTIDTPLAPTGRLQARCMGHALKHLGIAALWTSPQLRAHSTAEEISEIIGVAARVDKRLAERQLGKLQGTQFDVVKEKWPHAWKAWKAYAPLPEEIEAESEEEVKARLLSAFAALAVSYPGRTVAAVIHGGNGRCLLSRSIGNGTITRLVMTPGRGLSIRDVGISVHLPAGLDKDAVKASRL